MPTATASLVERIGDLIELANEARINFGGTHKLDKTKLEGIYNELRLIHRDAKKEAPPVFGRKIAEAQAAITFIKGEKKPDKIETYFRKLIEHLNSAIALLGIQKPKRKAA